MKLKDFIKQEIKVDFCNDVNDEYGELFVGPIYLTAEGEERFSYVLDIDIEVEESGYKGKAGLAVAKIFDYPDWYAKWFRLKNFLNYAAGYCSEGEWHKWFSEYSRKTPYKRPVWKNHKIIGFITMSLEEAERKNEMQSDVYYGHTDEERRIIQDGNIDELKEIGLLSKEKLQQTKPKKQNKDYGAR